MSPLGRSDCLSFSRFGKPVVSEVEVVFPILGGDVVFSFADVVAHEVTSTCSWLGLWCRSSEGIFLVELVDRDSMFEGEEFFGRVSPKVPGGARGIDRTRGNQSDELMLVDWQC